MQVDGKPGSNIVWAVQTARTAAWHDTRPVPSLLPPAASKQECKVLVTMSGSESNTFNLSNTATCSPSEAIFLVDEELAVLLAANNVGGAVFLALEPCAAYRGVLSNTLPNIRELDEVSSPALPLPLLPAPVSTSL